MKTNFSVVAGTMALLGWFLTFGLGLFVASKPYREQLLQSFEWKAFAVSLLTYTPTNIAALCMLGSFVGGCASRLVFSTASAILRKAADDSNKKSTCRKVPWRRCCAAS